MKIKCFVCGVLMALAVLAGPVRADVMALDMTGGSVTSVSQPPNVLGWQFTVGQDISVTSLGFFDVGRNGLVDSHEVGLWTSAGTLVASAIVTNSSTAVASTSSFGLWLFEPISPRPLWPEAT